MYNKDGSPLFVGRCQLQRDPEPEEVFIFVTARIAAARIAHIHCDGTFKAVNWIMFSQILIVTVRDGEEVSLKLGRA